MFEINVITNENSQLQIYKEFPKRRLFQVLQSVQLRRANQNQSLTDQLAAANHSS